MKWNHLCSIQSLASVMLWCSLYLHPIGAESVSSRSTLIQSVWDVAQRTVSRKTPIRLCGRSCSKRRDPAREPILELVREWVPVLRSGPVWSCAQVKELRSPQLRRWRMPGRLRRGSVLEVSSVCTCLWRLDWVGATSETVMAWKHDMKEQEIKHFFFF